MLTIQQAFIILAALVRKGASAYHKDYKRVCDVASMQYKLITGDGADELLTNFVPRESPEQLKQRINITQLTTKPLAGSIIQPFFRPGRLDNIKRFVGFDKQVNNADLRTQELEQYIGTFWGNESLEEYIAQRVPSLSFLDPNAFLVTEFANFDDRYQKARPYPVEYMSDEAVDFKYNNNELQYLIIKQSVTYITPAGDLATGEKYLMYLPNDIIELVQVAGIADVTGATVAGNYTSTELADFWNADASRRFQVNLYQPKGGKVQAKRIGYVFDAQTKGRTFVSPMDNALPYFIKAIKRVSELDLTVVLHVFPQKIFYAEACPGERYTVPAVGNRPETTGLAPCTAGINSRTGHKCRTCQGAGVVTHKSASDALPVKMPQPNVPVNVKLDDMVVYKAPPVELLNFMAENVKEVESDALRAVYNSEVLDRTEGAPETATARVIDKDEMYNTLAPFAKQCASIWRYFVELIAAFTDNDEGLTLVYDYPKDFKLKTVAELLADRKAAVDAGLPYHMIQAIDADIASKMFVDNEVAQLKFKVKQRFAPFLGKSADEVVFILSTGRARALDEVLYTHGDTIFDELETEVPGIYYMTPEKQWEYIKPKVDAIIPDLLANKATTLDLTGGTDDEGLPTGGDAGATDARAKLRTSVGAAGIVRQARLDVRDGIASREDAINQLVVQLGYSEADADKLIGTVAQIQKQLEQA